jgi:hypothetical protein
MNPCMNTVTERDVVEPCNVSQNTRGGIFFVVENKALSASLGKMMDVDEALRLAFISAARFSNITVHDANGCEV